jgi:hypothetical protein
MRRRRVWRDAAIDAGTLLCTALAIIGPPTATRALVVKILWAGYAVPWLGVRPMPYVIAVGAVLIATVLRPPNADNLRCSILELYTRRLIDDVAFLALGLVGLAFL